MEFQYDVRYFVKRKSRTDEASLIFQRIEGDTAYFRLKNNREYPVKLDDIAAVQLCNDQTISSYIPRSWRVRI